MKKLVKKFKMRSISPILDMLGCVNLYPIWIGWERCAAGTLLFNFNAEKKKGVWLAECWFLYRRTGWNRVFSILDDNDNIVKMYHRYIKTYEEKDFRLFLNKGKKGK